MLGTELPGDVVRWGAEHLVSSGAECCSACKKAQGCNSWVWCGHAAQCGGAHKQCWLKKRPNPYEDSDVLIGRSTKWTSGVVGAEPPRDPQAADNGGGTSGPSAVCDFALLTVEGLVRMRLRPQAKSAARYVAALLEELRAKQGQQGPSGGAGADSSNLIEAPAVDPARPVRDGLRFYRAEPVPARWGSLEWPDNYMGGRWGPPYALLQGSLRPSGTRVAPAAPDAGLGAKPIIRRGMVAWAGGGGGPDFFVALAQHPEWGNGHTVWAEVVPSDMAVIDKIMRRPLRVSNWGSINATELVSPLPYRLLAPEDLRRDPSNLLTCSAPGTKA